MNPIPVNTPKLDGNEAEYVMEAIRTGWISSEGPFVKEFESKFAERHGRKHGVAVSSGTAALQCAVDALDLHPGDEVIVPTFTIISCVNAVLQAGATPVLVDCDPLTFNSTPEQIEAVVTENTKAIMLVHLYGLPVDADPILELASEHGIQVIEDAAEAIGLDYKDRPCGSLGDLSIVSFYPNKHVTTGEGGMVLTDDDELAAHCRGSRNLFFQAKKRFYHERLGWNFRMTNLQAAVGLAQLERLEETIARKRKMGATYTQLLTDCPHLQLPLARTSYAKNIYWVYAIVLQNEYMTDATEIMAELAKLKIGSRPFFHPMHKQPIFRAKGLFGADSHPNAERIARRGFYVPGGVTLTAKEIAHVSNTLLSILNRERT